MLKKAYEYGDRLVSGCFQGFKSSDNRDANTYNPMPYKVLFHFFDNGLVADSHLKVNLVFYEYSHWYPFLHFVRSVMDIGYELGGIRGW